MEKLAAIDAQCVDIQNDRQHKGFIKITLHLTAERGPHLTNMMGWPTYTNPVPVALAVMEHQPQTQEQTPSRAGAAADSLRQLPQLNVGKDSSDPRFIGWLSDYRRIPMDKESTARFVRDYCGVKSRSEITRGTEAEQKWNLLYSAYLMDTA